ncbi:hypothetical protein EJ110_NYTH02170 [Nymphaea thermarum]|nr:hypothetical protein EJ110_NYTH02170 [Nymphaea thermarum]
MREVNTVHANCCRKIKAKLMDLRAFHEAWKKFTATEYINSSSAGKWPEAQACLLFASKHVKNWFWGVIVSLDQPAFDRCRRLHLHCYKLITDGVDFSGEKLFMSEDYLKMKWRRILFIEDVLRRGYDILFTDADILWLRNPFTRLSTENDLQLSCDRFIGRPYDNSNDLMAGFYFARANNKTIELYKLW